MKCRLCLKDKKLINSHIIPECFYTPIYDDRHHLNLVSTFPLKEKFKQKGLREKLLCEDCDNSLSPYEKYVREVFYGGVEIQVNEMKNLILLHNIDYNKFKLFQLSLLWRASISSLDFFSEINLSKSPHEEKLRKMIILKNPGEQHEYGCFIIMPIWEEKKVIDDFIAKPEYLNKIDDHRMYRFILGGCFWIFFVSSHTINIAYKNIFLNKNGILHIYKKSAIDIEYFREFAKNINK